MNTTSELATLVETETRLDEAVASARRAAEDARAAAHRRAALAVAQLEEAIERERGRIAEALALETAHHERVIEEQALAAIARFEAIRGDVLGRLARDLAQRLLAIVQEEP
jgi:acyl-CoA reductase-like NAD-dependent aldehyde dehydrogenase